MRQRQQQGLLRQRRVLDEPNAINFASNDYLGLSRHADMQHALSTATDLAIGASASPLVSGYLNVHQQLEQQLCHMTGYQQAMLFCSGFAANHCLLQTLSAAVDTVVADKLVHASVIDGIRASGVKLIRYRHNDVAHAQQCLQRAEGQTLLVTESVFSMDGDVAPLTQLSQLARAHGALLIVDDAHGFGVVGKNGLGASDWIEADALVVTFGKAMGCQGAAVLGSNTLIDYLQNFGRHYIYSTAPSPLLVEVAKTALSLIKNGAQRNRLLSNIEYFIRTADRHKLPRLSSTTAIQPILCQSQSVLKVASGLREKGLLVGAIRPPTVPSGSQRLRVTLSACHTHEQIAQLVTALSEELSIDG
ncbi:8-amino-7-oxononanoate synthase [Paraferrimonas haliotis]|uniref:8-amino-7-oxononanoate synthase n=1 Tax=Paraferrimonas haliotis TaxID=2013866 RepID=A0AA37TJP0_9GAMM|nr:8-amino-7-oxononanoate synthase [Paraferrimonas haliotis]